MQYPLVVRLESAAFACGLMLLSPCLQAAAEETVTIEQGMVYSFTSQIVDAVGKYQELQKDVAAANASYETARIAFYTELDKGVLNSPEQQTYFALLDEKDIYYLSLYLSEGYRKIENDITLNATGQAKITGDLSVLGRTKSYVESIGGQIDGGIHSGRMPGYFNEWVEAVRRALGARREGEFVMPAGVDALKAALLKASKEYNEYREVRNEWEFNEWKFRRRVHTPAAPTPEQMADVYAKYVVHPLLCGRY